jgi:RNA polymerase sigma-70 factor (ECF subfamily)
MYAPVDAQLPPNQDFADIYKTYYRRVFGLCRYLLNSFDAAEDATHEVFLRAQRKLASYDPSQPLANWLLGIASHHCVDLLRRRSVESRIFEIDETFEAPSGGPGPLSEVLAAERGDTIRTALLQLPEKFRIPLVLTYYNDLSYDEIAEVMGLKRNHVATLIFRAKQQMREKLARKEKNHELS